MDDTTELSLCDLPGDRNWRRRLVTTPVPFLLAIVAVVTLPVVLPLAALVDLVVRRRWSVCRTVLLLTYFALLEALGLLILCGLWLRRLTGLDEKQYRAANRQMQRWWVRRLFDGTVRIFSMSVDIQGRQHLEASAPSVVLSRHANTLDTLLPPALSRVPKRFRYVMKSELLVDPALDYCGHRFPNVFVRRGSDSQEREIAKVVALGHNLADGDAVVVYPEGTRFSEQKRDRLLAKYRDDEQMRPIVESLHHTLPPLRRGTIELLASTTGSDVVFIAHRGLEEATDFSDLVTGALTGGRLDVAIWRVPADAVPRHRKGIRTFLVDHWRHIDDYVAGSPPPRGSSDVSRTRPSTSESHQPDAVA